MSKKQQQLYTNNITMSRNQLNIENSCLMLVSFLHLINVIWIAYVLHFVYACENIIIWWPIREKKMQLVGPIIFFIDVHHIW